MEPIPFDVSLTVYVSPAEAETVLRAARDSGVDYGDTLLTLHKAAVVLVNAGNFNNFDNWSAGPLHDETTLRDLLMAKLAQYNLTEADFPNWFLAEDGQPDRFVAVERTVRDGKATHWIYTIESPEGLAETMDECEANQANLLFVTDLITGRELEASTKLAFV